jgi:hypothetical protein
MMHAAARSPARRSPETPVAKAALAKAVIVPKIGELARTPNSEIPRSQVLAWIVHATPGPLV